MSRRAKTIVSGWLPSASDSRLSASVASATGSRWRGSPAPPSGSKASGHAARRIASARGLPGLHPPHHASTMLSGAWHLKTRRPTEPHATAQGPLVAPSVTARVPTAFPELRADRPYHQSATTAVLDPQRSLQPSWPRSREPHAVNGSSPRLIKGGHFPGKAGRAS